MSAGQESGSPLTENRTLLPAPLPPDEARGTLVAAAGVSTVGLRPPLDTPAAAFSSCLSRHSHLDCRARIAHTTTKKGLSISCELDRNAYPKGIKVSDAEMASLNITRDAFHPEWNYTISPRNSNMKR